jgi:hypothetical protein
LPAKGGRQGKKMYRSQLSVAALILAMSLTGCATVHRFNGNMQLSPNAEIIVVRATARMKRYGILIDGDVRRVNGYATAVPGHLEVVARDGSGNVVTTTKTNWGQFMNRRFRLAYFTAFLRVSDPSIITTISIEPVTLRPAETHR